MSLHADNHNQHLGSSSGSNIKHAAKPNCPVLLLAAADCPCRWLRFCGSRLRFWKPSSMSCSGQLMMRRCGRRRSCMATLDDPAAVCAGSSSSRLCSLQQRLDCAGSSSCRSGCATGLVGATGGRSSSLHQPSSSWLCELASHHMGSIAAFCTAAFVYDYCACGCSGMVCLVSATSAPLHHLNAARPHAPTNVFVAFFHCTTTSTAACCRPVRRV